MAFIGYVIAAVSGFELGFTGNLLWCLPLAFGWWLATSDLFE